MRKESVPHESYGVLYRQQLMYMAVEMMLAVTRFLFSRLILAQASPIAWAVILAKDFMFSTSNLV